MFKNPYISPTPKELEKKYKEQETIKKKINATIEIAKRILDSTDGITYRESMKQLRRDLNKHVLEAPGFADPLHDAHFLRGCIIKMGVLDMLLGEIERDSKRNV